jgi:hypothetical protein
MFLIETLLSNETIFVLIPATAGDLVSQDKIEEVVFQGRLQASTARVSKAVCGCRMGLIAPARKVDRKLFVKLVRANVASISSHSSKFQ